VVVNNPTFYHFVTYPINQLTVTINIAIIRVIAEVNDNVDQCSYSLYSLMFSLYRIIEIVTANLIVFFIVLDLTTYT